MDSGKVGNLARDFEVLDRGLPLQQQIFAELRAELLDGLWVNRSDFYTEKEISERFDVSLITSRAVLDRLADEGWISRARGRRSLPIRDPEENRDWTDVPPVTGGPKRSFDYEVISSDVRVAPAEACKAFGRPMGSQLWQCIRVRSLDGEIHSVTHNAQDPELGTKHALASLAHLPMTTILHQLGEHVSILRRQVSPVSPPPYVARLLSVTLGTPTLLYTCTLHRKDDSVIEWLRVYINPIHRPAPEVFDLDTGSWVHLVRP